MISLDFALSYELLQVVRAFLQSCIWNHRILHTVIVKRSHENFK